MKWPLTKDQNLIAGLVVAVALLAGSLWWNFGRADTTAEPSPTITVGTETAAPGTEAPTEPGEGDPASTEPAGVDTAPEMTPGSSEGTPGPQPDPDAEGAWEPNQLDPVPSPGPELDTLVADLETTAGEFVDLWFSYGAGDATALDRLERAKPVIHDSLLQELAIDYEDHEFEEAIEEGLWNTVEVLDTETGLDPASGTVWVSEMGVFNVFVTARQGWIPPGNSLDERLHYKQLWLVQLIRTEDGVKVVNYELTI